MFRGQAVFNGRDGDVGLISDIGTNGIMAVEPTHHEATAMEIKQFPDRTGRKVLAARRGTHVEILCSDSFGPLSRKVLAIAGVKNSLLGQRKINSVGRVKPFAFFQKGPHAGVCNCGVFHYLFDFIE